MPCDRSSWPARGVHSGLEQEVVQGLGGSQRRDKCDHLRHLVSSFPVLKLVDLGERSPDTARDPRCRPCRLSDVERNLDSRRIGVEAACTHAAAASAFAQCVTAQCKKFEVSQSFFGDFGTPSNKEAEWIRMEFYSL